MFKKKILNQIDYFSELLDADYFLEDLQFHMIQENFERDIEIITNGDICEKLYFIVDGDISI
jgi:hypothetical protein